MKVNRIRHRWKVLATGTMALVCIAVAFNIWFVQNTNAIIESLVRSQSNGHIQLQLNKSKFQYFRKKIVLYGATFTSEDTTGSRTLYSFQVPKLDLKIRSFWAFWLRNELLIDSIALNAPEVTVTLLSKAAKQEKTSISIPEEIGRIYNSILDALQVLQVRRFQIDDGRFRLVNKTDPEEPVTAISNIHFNINNLKITADSAARNKFLYSDNVVLRVTDQDITFPDGVHHMSFKNLLINVGNKQVQLDSCWLRAENRNDKNAFRIFFDVLKMTNLDFASLYRKSLIKADSVYIDNPDINLALEIKRKKEGNKKLELDTIIQQFTGDLALGYIGVQNATVNIIANRSDTTTTFSSKHDNFNMFGLRVNSDSAQPVYVNEFAMILRNYETYSRDSSRLYRFDSLRFTNNKVRLSNFSIRSIATGPNKSSLYYSIPAFELTGLSWEDLLFERYISAQKAVLYNPEIQFTIGASPKHTKNRSLFKILSGLNETIDLAEVEIRNGDLKIVLPGDKRLNLQQVDLVLASNKLLASKSYTGMQQAINELAFRNAVFTTGNLRAELINLHYTNQLYADALLVTNSDKTLVAQANGITLNDLVWNNENKSVFVDHLGWQQASITLHTGGSKKLPKQTNALVELNNLYGKNTAVTIYAGDKTIRTKIDHLRLDDFIQVGGGTIVLHGLDASGTAMDVNAPAYHITSGHYHLTDSGASSIHNLAFLQPSPKDTLSIFIAQTFLKPHIEALLKGNLHFSNVTAAAPVFRFINNATLADPPPPSKAAMPLFVIDALALQNPVVQYVINNIDTTTINWSRPGSTSSRNYWAFTNVRTAPTTGTVSVDKAELSGTNILLHKNEKTFGIDSGLVQLHFNNILFSSKNGTHWTANLEEALFKNPISLALKVKGGIGMEEARLRHLNLSSESVKNLYQLVQSNPAMQLQITKGSYATDASQLQWNDLVYSQASGTLSIDSFSYQPVLARDSFIAKAPGQTDYMHAVLKNITATGIDLTAFEKDTVFTAHSIVLDAPTLDIYRDKRKPFIPGEVRLLPSLALQQLPAKISADTLALQNATVRYTEMSEKTGQEGTFTINRIHAQLFPIRNINLTTTDSLTVHAEGYLMDSAWLRLRLKESYTDSLGTFAMTLRAKPADLSVFNAALVPLASVKLTSGELDTITMRAIGQDYYAIGAMQMYYKNLKVQFLKKGSETKKTFLTGLITFAANNFVIRKNNTSRTGTVYFLRNRDRSFFNYLVKTALSGIASSVGAKKNKKYNKQYKRQQKLYNLPPVDFS